MTTKTNTTTVETCECCGKPATVRLRSKCVPGGRREGVDWSDAETARYCTDCYDARIIQQNASISYRGYEIRDVGHCCLIKKGSETISAQPRMEAAKKLIDEYFGIQSGR